MKRKVVLVLCILLVIVILISSSVYYFWYVPYVYVPQALGRQYMSVSFWPELMGNSNSSPTPLHLTYQGKAINVTYVSIGINVTNSYFQPVYINFSGFDVVWLIYDRTVTDPSDVLSNKDSLVWGAYYYLVYEGIVEPHRGIHDFTGDGLESIQQIETNQISRRTYRAAVGQKIITGTGCSMIFWAVSGTDNTIPMSHSYLQERISCTA